MSASSIHAQTFISECVWIVLYFIYYLLRWTALAFLIFYPCFPWCVRFQYTYRLSIHFICVWNVQTNCSYFIYAISRISGMYTNVYTHFAHIYIDYKFCKQWTNVWFLVSFAFVFLSFFLCLFISLFCHCSNCCWTLFL